MIDPVNRKLIIKNLHNAIDSEISNKPEDAYVFYLESLELVVGELKKDVREFKLSLNDKFNLVDFAKQSIDRIRGLVRKEGPSSPSAPQDLRPSAPVEYQARGDEDTRLVSTYRRKMDASMSAVERQNFELEMARKWIENDAIRRNRLMQETTWAMENAFRKFNMREKIDKGAVKPSDWKKQELYALALQYNQNIAWLGVLGQDLALYPNNDRIVKEILDILMDHSHPIRMSLNYMQDKINDDVNAFLMRNELDAQEAGNPREFMNSVGKTIKEDLDVILDVIKALFNELDCEKNAAKTSEYVYDVFFKKVKKNIVALIRRFLKAEEAKLACLMTQEKTANLDDVDKEAVTKLHYMSTLDSPYSMMDCLVRVVQILATSKFDQEHCTAMGTDDLLPKLCQVLVSSSMPTIAAEAHFMETFMPAERALGEAGYALTTLQSALQYVISSD